MCGRYALIQGLKDLSDQFNAQVRDSDIKPNYNVAPTQQVAVVTRNGQRTIQTMRWGLIPFWAKDEKIGYKLINARAETITEKASYKHPFQKNRCLIPADGFFEWNKSGTKKQPYFFHMKDRHTFAFAGLWSSWTSPDSKDIKSCTIITTEPNTLVKKFHDRMPVIIPQAAYELWLNPIEEEYSLLQNLKPFPASKMTAYPVSPAMNSPRINNESCVKEI